MSVNPEPSPVCLRGYSDSCRPAPPSFLPSRRKNPVVGISSGTHTSDNQTTFKIKTGRNLHPTHSNIARAEVIAVRMGLETENNEYVDASSYTYPRVPSQSSDTPAHNTMYGWGTGNGRDVAQGLLGDSSSIPNPGL